MLVEAMDLEPRAVDVARLWAAMRSHDVTPWDMAKLGDAVADGVLAGYVPPPALREAIGKLVGCDPDELFPRAMAA